MNHRKPNFKTVCGGFLAIFAGFAFAPIFEAVASFVPAHHSSPAQVVAGDDHATPNAGAPKTLQSRKGASNPSSTVPSSQPEQPAAASESGASKPDDFDGPTTFAKNELGSNNALNNVSDARIFSKFGSGGGVSASPTTVQKKMGAAAPSKDETNDKTDASPSDKHDQTKSQDQARDESKPEWQTDKPRDDNKPIASVPEPSALALIFVGVCGLVVARKLA